MVYEYAAVGGDAFGGEVDFFGGEVVVEFYLGVALRIGYYVWIPEKCAAQILEWGEYIEVFLLEYFGYVIALEPCAAKSFLTF